jgi:hypothetical protein
VLGVFEDRVSQIICLGWPGTKILISTFFWVVLGLELRAYTFSPFL